MAKKKPSRNIPPEISDKVKSRHFFECAWCGVKLFERHHIKEFHLGGEHIEENLILLCPNHHTMAHNGDISPKDLINRKSTHIKGDRLTGDFKTTIEDLKIFVNGGFAFNSPNLLIHKGNLILSIDKKNDNILEASQFYNKQGELIFWMRRNMFWSVIDIEVSAPKVDFLQIKNSDESVFLRIEKKEDYLKVKMNTYLSGDLVKFTEEAAIFPNGSMIVGPTLINIPTWINFKNNDRK
jgi:hypothetical protein